MPFSTSTIPVRRRLVGGSLLTLLSVLNRGVILQDPWLARCRAIASVVALRRQGAAWRGGRHDAIRTRAR
jgi:hypothetical protein